MKKILLLLVLLGTFASCKQEKDTPERETIKPDMTQYVKMEAIGEQANGSSIHVLGIVTSETQATPAFKTGGVIERTFVKEGDSVKKGQLLATLLMTEINAQVAQAEQGFAKAQRDAERAENMYRDSVATLEQVQNARTGVTVAEKTLEIAKFNQQHSTVTAPISGHVIKQILHTGEIAGPGMPVYAILGVSKKDWKVTAKMIDKDWAKVHVGDRVNISFDAYPNKKFKGKVRKKAILATDASGSLDVEFTLFTQPKSLAIGMVARIDIAQKQTSKNMSIPIEAIVKSNGTTATVYTVVNGKAKLLEISISQMSGNRVIVSSGLEGVDKVVTIGAIFLEDGSPVVVAN